MSTVLGKNNINKICLKEILRHILFRNQGPVPEIFNRRLTPTFLTTG